MRTFEVRPVFATYRSDCVAQSRDVFGSRAAASADDVVTEIAFEGGQLVRELVRRLAQSIEAPLVIDSTEPRVLETALRNYPGRAVINSVHLESGRTKMDAVVPMAREHGAALVALTIDESGMGDGRLGSSKLGAELHDANKQFQLPMIPQGASKP